MGFKDWGAWNLVEQYFLDRNVGFCKFNMTHNGGDLQQAEDFPDLDAFSKNRYSYELNDLEKVISFVKLEVSTLKKLVLIGHSRGGGIALLQAKNPAVDAVITLAAISSIGKRFSDEQLLKDWREKGVRYVENQRTKQLMPHLYIQVEDFLTNNNSLNIEASCRLNQKPILVIHGEKDSSVSIQEGEEIALWSNTNLHVIKETDHVFGSSHPWMSNELPTALNQVCELVNQFLKSMIY
jgi:pimeloyl-ACP methyl ester carboxylesterase